MPPYPGETLSKWAAEQTPSMWLCLSSNKYKYLQRCLYSIHLHVLKVELQSLSSTFILDIHSVQAAAGFNSLSHVYTYKATTHLQLLHGGM